MQTKGSQTVAAAGRAPTCVELAEEGVPFRPRLLVHVSIQSDPSMLQRRLRRRYVAVLRPGTGAQWHASTSARECNIPC